MPQSINPLCSHSVSNAPKQRGVGDWPACCACLTNHHASTNRSDRDEAQKIMRRWSCVKPPRARIDSDMNMAKACVLHHPIFASDHAVLARYIVLKWRRRRTAAVDKAVNNDGVDCP
eukprot:gnl/TRDRNA2_/TRDRNA2_64123_c0_seq1.p1 gnl/TRDRNA2_/TRDRNA2_64123_c0~~gnl/TRDRNA2_/TRDRNA2_64123_c0_seq1.p1  ORF type:complete len:117 (+),score=14.04 gnl/TRDRNA2_/TRDRNA2_64123_c0_seq1:136-486(+)